MTPSPLPRVLIVDGDPHESGSLSQVFAGVDVDVIARAASTHEALTMARRHEPDAVVVDDASTAIHGESVGNAIHLLVPDALVVAFSRAPRSQPVWADSRIDGRSFGARPADVSDVMARK